MTVFTKRRRTRWRAWLELARASNLPTTLTNVLVGVAAMAEGSAVDWWAVCVAASGIACFYIAGMALNDWMDAGVDSIERPGRPIPSGSISLRAAIIAVVVLFLAGLAVLSTRGLPCAISGLVLGMLIVFYNSVHRRWPGSVLIMGLCRAMVYVTAAAATAWPVTWPTVLSLGGTMMAYIVLMSVIARAEMVVQMDRRRWIALALPMIALAPMLAIQPSNWVSAAVMAGAMIAWLLFAARFVVLSPTRPRQAVMAWLAGICLVDAWFVMLLDQPALALVAGACFGLTLAAQRFVAGT